MVLLGLLSVACASNRAHPGKEPSEVAPADEAAATPVTPSDQPESAAAADPEPSVDDGEAARPPTPEPAPEPEPAAAETSDKGRKKPRRRELCERPEASDDLVRVGDMQEVLEETTCAAALWLDGLFGEEQNLESARRTHGFVEASSAYSEFDGPDQKLRFRVRFKLPNLKNRFNLIVGRDDEDDFTRDRTQRFAVRSQLRNFENNSDWLAGLGYSLPGTARFSSNFRIGASNLTNPRLFVQQPTRYVLYSDPEDLVYVRGTPFWTNQDGFGFTSGINYNHVLSPTLLLRLSETGTVSQKTDGYDWFTGLILYQNLRKDRALSYQLIVRGASNAPEPLFEYGGRVVYRQPLIRDRLIAEILTGYTWPRVDPDLKREGSAEVGLSLSVPFGDKDD
ncbi:MAG: hypothetical protein ACT4P0_11830 [Panacagrimonas sp.]